MYANEETYEYSADSKRAIQYLIDLGYERGLLSDRVDVEFA
jgi:hypothetical protein